MPGPGSYAMGDNFRKTGGKFGKDPKIADQRTMSPGPGAYDPNKRGAGGVKIGTAGRPRTGFANDGGGPGPG